MLWAAIDQMPIMQKFVAQGAIGVAASCFALFIAIRIWRALRRD
jgi:hypothetical protein